MLAAEDEFTVNPIMAITKASDHVAPGTTPNPILSAKYPEAATNNPLSTVQQQEPTPMMFNPMVARGTSFATPPTTPLSSGPILVGEPVAVPVEGYLASQAPIENPVIRSEGPVEVDIPPPVESVPEIQAVLEEAQADPALAPIQTPRNVEVSLKDRTRVKPLSGGNNGPVPTALARAQGGSPSHSPFLGFGRVSPAPKKSFADLARKLPSRPDSQTSGSRRTSPAVSPYGSPANSRQSSPTRGRGSRRSSPANSRQNSPTRGTPTHSRATSDVAGRPPKPSRASAATAAPAAALEAAVAELVPAQSTPPSDSWLGAQIPPQSPGMTRQQPEVQSQQAQAAASAASLENFPPAKARAAALRREQEVQTGRQLQQQPLSVSSRISRSAKEKAAADEAAAQPFSYQDQAASSSAPFSSSLAAIKTPAPPANPKAKIMEQLRTAELARAIAPEPRTNLASSSVDAPPSKLAFGDVNSGSGLMEQPKALTAKHFKALARQLEDNKPIEDALAVEAGLSLAHMEQNTSMSRRSQGAAPETIAEAEPLQDPRAAADGGGQQDMLQSPFAAAAQGKFLPRMSAEDMTAMAMGAIDRIRGRAMQPDDLPVELGPPRPDRGATRSLSLPKQGSSEDLSAIALAAIARLRNMADKAKESPRSSSAPRPDRIPDFDFERERSQRLHLPSGPVRFGGSTRGPVGPAGPSRPTSPLPVRTPRAQHAMEAGPTQPLRQERQAEFTPSRTVRPDRPAASKPTPAAVPTPAVVPARQALPQVLQHRAVTPTTPSTPARPVPEVPVASTPPSRSWSPDSAVPDAVVSAAEVAAEARRPTTTSLAEVVNAPAQAHTEAAAVKFESQQHAVPAEHAGVLTRPLSSQAAPDMVTGRQPAARAMPAEPVTPSDSGSDTSDSFTVPPRQLVASRVVTLPSQPVLALQSETRVPDSPDASSVSSSMADEDEEPFVFDEAAAAAKAKEKGKAVLSQPEIRPVRYFSKDDGVSADLQALSCCHMFCRSGMRLNSAVLCTCS